MIRIPFQNPLLAVVVAAGLLSVAPTAWAQSVPVAAPVSVPADGLSDIVKLSQAKVGDDIIITFIKNSGYVYNLTAAQIIYLRQNGVSDPVITAILTLPRGGVAMAPAPALAPVSAASQPAETAYAPSSSPTDVVSGPPPATPPASYVQTAPSSTVTYVQTVPSTYYYYQPYYYPAYGYYAYPPVSVSLGWGWGWGGGWGWRGGWGGRGGWHR